MVAVAWEYSKLDKEVTIRWKKLGDLGEYLAEVLFRRAGFENIRNLNKERTNKMFADVYAEREKKAYIVSVKARNKYQKSGKLNDRYKLNYKCYEHSKIVENEYKAIAAWLTIAIDVGKGIFDAYYGLLADLRGNKGVLMTPKAVQKYQCLGVHGKLEDHGITEDVYKKLKNVYRSKK